METNCDNKVIPDCGCEACDSCPERLDKYVPWVNSEAFWYAAAYFDLNSRPHPTMIDNNQTIEHA